MFCWIPTISCPLICREVHLHLQTNCPQICWVKLLWDSPDLMVPGPIFCLFSNLACDWLSIVWAYSEQETENGSRTDWLSLTPYRIPALIAPTLIKPRVGTCIQRCFVCSYNTLHMKIFHSFKLAKATLKSDFSFARILHVNQWWLRSGQCNKNTKSHTAHTIVSWPNPKQWVIVHTSDLMIIRQSIYILSVITRKWVNWKHTAPHIV